jgi:hypothetical protein
VLANIPFEDLGLDGVLGNMNKVQFRTLEVYIKRTTRSASLQDSSFEYLLDKLVTVADFIESLTIDYTEGPDFDPHVGLGQCDRAFSFDMFLRLRKLIVLQQAIMRCNFRRRLEFEDLATYFPPTLESLTIGCPTEAILKFLEGVQDARSRGGVSKPHKVTLLCRCSYGVAPDTFETPEAEKLFHDLRVLGIDVRVEEETPGAFAAQARAMGSVWEADWSEESWADGLFGVEG